MSDLMLTAVLSMPYDMAMADDLSRRQFYDRAQQALEEIERLTAERYEHAHWRRDLADKLHYRETDIIELRQQLAEAEQHARRYRWLRVHVDGDRWYLYYDDCGRDLLQCDALDAAIDAAMGLTRPAEDA